MDGNYIKSPGKPVSPLSPGEGYDEADGGAAIAAAALSRFSSRGWSECRPLAKAPTASVATALSRLSTRGWSKGTLNLGLALEKEN